MTVTAATTPSSGPCSAWCTEADVFECDGCAAIEDAQDLIDLNITIATDLLYRATGMQFAGSCTTKIRPACTVDLCDLPGGWWQGGGYPDIPDIVAGRWYNMGGNNTRCTAYDCGQTFGKLDTLFWPVTAAAVKIDGVAFTGYRIDEWRYLTRTDGSLWPSTQNLTLDDTQVGTWSATLTHGAPLPTALVMAAAQLACELTRHCRGDQKCSLPLRVTQMNRQGVTYNIANVMDIVKTGKTGLYYVDLCIQQYNPHSLIARPRILSPDRRSHRRTGS